MGFEPNPPNEILSHASRSLAYTFCRFLQLSKAEVPMLVTLEEIVTSTSFEQPENKYYPIFVTLSGITIVAIPLQPYIARSPICLIVLGSSMLTSEAQLPKA